VTHDFDSLFEVCRWLRVERLERGWTMREAAARSGVSVSTICRLEQADKGLVAENLVKVLDAYGYRLSFKSAVSA
jgi:transcriptional regulator with XRE-family HTH domain